MASKKKNQPHPLQKMLYRLTACIDLTYFQVYKFKDIFAKKEKKKKKVLI